MYFNTYFSSGIWILCDWIMNHIKDFFLRKSKIIWNVTWNQLETKCQSGIIECTSGICVYVCWCWLTECKIVDFPNIQRFDGLNIEHEGINDFLKCRYLQLYSIPINENMLIFNLILSGIMFSSILFRFNLIKELILLFFSFCLSWFLTWFDLMTNLKFSTDSSTLYIFPESIVCLCMIMCFFYHFGIWPMDEDLFAADLVLLLLLSHLVTRMLLLMFFVALCLVYCLSLFLYFCVAFFE